MKEFHYNPENLEIFKPMQKYVLIVSLSSLLFGIGFAMFFHAPDIASIEEMNEKQGQEFLVTKQSLSGINENFAATFAPPDTATLKMRMAQKGYVALIDNNELSSLFGYAELEKIITNKTSNVSSLPMEAAEFPIITPKVFIFNEDKGTTLVQYSYKGVVKQQMWRWRKDIKTGAWSTDSIPQEFIAKDIELSRNGVSFILAFKENPSILRTYILSGTTGQ